MVMSDSSPRWMKIGLVESAVGHHNTLWCFRYFLSSL